MEYVERIEIENNIIINHIIGEKPKLVMIFVFMNI